MVETADRTKRVVQVGLQRRSNPALQEAVGFVQSGGIGQVTVAKGYHLQNEWPNGIGAWPDEAPPAPEQWDKWLGPAPKVPYNKNRTFYHFRWFYDYSGGQVTNFGVHYVDTLRWLLGKESPRAVTAMGGKYAVKDNREIPDTAEILWEYEGPVMMVFSQYNANNAPAAPTNCEMELRGTKGTMYIDLNGWEVVPQKFTDVTVPARTPVGPRCGAVLWADEKGRNRAPIGHGQGGQYRTRAELSRLRQVTQFENKLRCTDRAHFDLRAIDWKHCASYEILSRVGCQGGAIHQQRSRKQVSQLSVSSSLQTAMTRRSFLATAAAAPVMGAAPGRPLLCIFSKHMAQLNFDEMGKHARQIGFDGVDLTVRPKGHVLPENAAKDLPRAYDVIRSHGLSVAMITTNILQANEPATRPILQTAGKLKIPYWKPGYYKYDVSKVENEVKRVTRSVQGLVEIGKESGIVAGFHNHSGEYIGSAVWDIRTIIHDMDPKWIGYYYDPAHATIEGGLAGWRISQNMALPRLKMVALKDFYWDKNGRQMGSQVVSHG